MKNDIQHVEVIAASVMADALTPIEQLRLKNGQLQRENEQLQLECERFKSGILTPEEQVRVIVENIHEGILLTDLDDVVIYANGHMAQMSGYEVGEMLGQPAYQLFLPPEDWRIVQNQNQERALGQHSQYELLMRRKDGSRFWCLVNASPLRNARGEVVGTLGAQSDITARKEAELRQSQLRAQLERSNSELQAFAYAASHDLKEPLRKINVFGSRLESSLRGPGSSLDESHLDYLRRMQAAARRMTGLIDGLLLYSRVTTGAAEFQPVDLGAIVNEVMQDFEIEISSAHARVEVKPLPVVRADAQQMRQLVHHLLSNALQFRREEEPLQLQIFDLGDQTHWKICFADNGRGFDGEQAPRLFEMFARLDGRATAQSSAENRGAKNRGQAENLGVGLSLCRKIVERHGGWIEAFGQVGQGACFQITLPHEPASEASAELFNGKN